MQAQSQTACRNGESVDKSGGGEREVKQQRAAASSGKRSRLAVYTLTHTHTHSHTLTHTHTHSLSLSAPCAAGHALCALYTDGAVPLYKATIVPRGNALGMVTQLPEDDTNSITKQEMLARLVVCMGGRAAEEKVFGAKDVTSGEWLCACVCACVCVCVHFVVYFPLHSFVHTFHSFSFSCSPSPSPRSPLVFFFLCTGASSDVSQATQIARAMVMKYAMSDKVWLFCCMQVAVPWSAACMACAPVC